MVRERLKNTDCLRKGNALGLHEERDHVPVLLTAEAMEGLRVGKDGEGWHVILVKAAAAHERSAGPIERQVLADDLLDSDGCFEAPDVRVSGGTARSTDARTRRCSMVLDDRRGRRFAQEPKEVVSRFPESDEEVRHVASVADLVRKGHDPRTWDETSHPLGSSAASVVIVEADVDPWDVSDFLCP